MPEREELQSRVYDSLVAFNGVACWDILRLAQMRQYLAEHLAATFAEQAAEIDRLRKELAQAVEHRDHWHAEVKCADARIAELTGELAKAKDMAESHRQNAYRQGELGGRRLERARRAELQRDHIVAELDELKTRVAELERPAVEAERAEIRQSFMELSAQAQEDRDFEGAFNVDCRLREREEQWAREDAAKGGA